MLEITGDLNSGEEGVWRAGGSGFSGNKGRKEVTNNQRKKESKSAIPVARNPKGIGSQETTL